MKKYGVKIWAVTPAAGGFGEFESCGPVWVRKDSITRDPSLDGLIHNQTGPAVRAETSDGIPIRGMLPA